MLYPMSETRTEQLLEEVSEAHAGPASAPDDDARRQLVQRILASPDFVRSPQLAKFLLYISEVTLNHKEQALTEQHIGTAVFGREPDYDSAADTIVRSNALRLRRRLEQYFQRAGHKEPLRLVIPRGGYAPLFVQVEEITSSASQVSDPSSSSDEGITLDPAHSANAPATTSTNTVTADSTPVPYLPLVPGTPDPRLAGLRSIVWRYRLLTSVLSLGLVAAGILFGLHLRTHLRPNRHHPLWSRLFSDDQHTQIVLGDSGLVLFHAFARQYVSLHDYLTGDYSKQMPSVEHIEPEFARFLLHRRYTSVVDAMTLSHLMQLPEAAPERTLVHYSRDMHIEDFTSDNVIMIGAEEAVPWVELFEKHMDFFFSIDNPDKHAAFLNRNPKPGELREYSSATPATASKVYGVVAFLSNLSGHGNVLIIEGLSMVGTEAASDLVIHDERLLPILKTVRRPDGTLPHFEMLVESDILGDGDGPPRVVSVHLHD